jgi:hypothetical protein
MVQEAKIKGEYELQVEKMKLTVKDLEREISALKETTKTQQ